MLHRRTLLPLLLCAVVVAPLACSSDESSESGEASATTAADAAQSGDTAAGGQSGDVDVCSLITVEQVGAALGEPVEAGEPATMGPPGCSWMAPGGDTLTTAVGPSVQLMTMQQFVFDGSLSEPVDMEGLRIEEIEGVGERAYLTFAEPAPPSLAFTQNGIYLSVTVDNPSLSEQQIIEAERQVANDVIAGL